MIALIVKHTTNLLNTQCPVSLLVSISPLFAFINIHFPFSDTKQV